MGSSQAAPQAPTAPSTASGVDAWVANMPKVFAEQQRQAPLEAQQQIDLATQYAQPYAEALKTSQETLYPGETKLREGLLSQAQEGMSGDMPQWMKDSYIDTFNANLGTNVGSPIGADYMSRGMLQQQQNWQDQYRNLGQSLIGTQPTFNAQAPQTSNFASGFTPGAVMGNQQQGFGTQANIFGTQSQNWQQQQQAPYQMMSGIGNIIGGTAGQGGGFMGWGK